MIADLVLGFLGVSILFYCLFAGADFGAGILEIFLGKKLQEEQKKLITRAMSPVWEANHVWLILAVVIVFNAFPRVYSQLSISLHIPLTLMLMGVILRGCSFTFRHYDVDKGPSQKVYSFIFSTSSVLTPFFLGVVAAGMILGRIGSSDPSFNAQYIDPWFRGFSCFVGVFVCALFTFLAAAYLAGDARDQELKQLFVRRAKVANLVAVVAGAGVFVSAEVSGFRLMQRFFSDPFSIGCFILATLGLAPIWWALKSGRAWTVRILAGLQVTLVLLGWFSVQYPVLIALAPDSSLMPFDLVHTAAPAATLRYLLGALVAGSLLILPALVFLLRTFKRDQDSG